MVTRQRGVSLSGLLMVVVALVVVAIAGLKVIPHYIEDKEIKSKFDEIARDPEMKAATVSTIRMAFNKRATVADITAIKSDDIDVSKSADGIALSASYSVKVPLFGNASLLLEFNPSSSK